jgi:pimeloyl-ACP methyl ester carboxylesterase
MTVDVTSDGAPLSLTIESPSGNRWIPEMMPAEKGFTIGHQLTVPETGDYLVTLGKGEPSSSTNFTVTFTIQSASSAGSEGLTPTGGQVEANGITIAYESFGATNRETILLIPGTGMQLVDWPIELVEELVARGYRVVRFDNRDIGLSTKHTEAGLPDNEAIGEAIEAGEPVPMPYTLQDMAGDAVGLLDALGIQQAHLVGVSMGGAIAQLVAIDYPQRTLSLTSIAADSGNPDLPVIAKPEAFEGVPPQPTTVDRESFIEWQVKTWQALGSPDYPTDELTLRQMAQRDFERNFDPEALVRQQTASFLGHIESSHYRLNNLQNIEVPTVVLHGSEDPLVPVESAEDIAARVPNAELRIIPGLGHDIPVALVPEFADAITAAATRASPVAKHVK